MIATISSFLYVFSGSDNTSKHLNKVNNNSHNSRKVSRAGFQMFTISQPSISLCSVQNQLQEINYMYSFFHQQNILHSCRFIEEKTNCLMIELVSDVMQVKVKLLKYNMK